jgi:hypothetical protein
MPVLQYHITNVCLFFLPLWREAEKLIGEDGARQMVDPLYVIETVMRYFFGLAQSGHRANVPLDEVRKCFREAAQLAALAAPYRHARLSAVMRFYFLFVQSIASRA